MLPHFVHSIIDNGHNQPVVCTISFKVKKRLLEIYDKKNKTMSSLVGNGVI